MDAKGLKGECGRILVEIEAGGSLLQVDGTVTEVILIGWRKVDDALVVRGVDRGVVIAVVVVIVVHSE